MLRCRRRQFTENPTAGALKALLGGGKPDDSSTGDRKEPRRGQRLKETYHWASLTGTTVTVRGELPVQPEAATM